MRKLTMKQYYSKQIFQSDALKKLQFAVMNNQDWLQIANAAIKFADCVAKIREHKVSRKQAKPKFNAEGVFLD